jgi:hypothetical protein
MDENNLENGDITQLPPCLYREVVNVPNTATTGVCTERWLMFPTQPPQVFVQRGG